MKWGIENVLWVSLGFFISEGYRRFRSRLAIIRWQAYHDRLALSAADHHFGNLEVRHNGEPVANIFATRIEIRNPTNRDLQNLKFRFTFNEGARVRSARAQLVGGDAYDVARDADREQYDVAICEVPVLNRSAQLNVVFLVETGANQQPFVMPTCVHAGLELKQESKPTIVPTKLFGVDIGRAALAGIAIAVVATMAIMYLFQPASWFVWASLVIGMSANIIGAFVVRFWRWMLQVFG